MSSSRADNPCTICGKSGIPGLIKGCGKCQYHWNVGVYGQEWADKIEADKRKGENDAQAV